MVNATTEKMNNLYVYEIGFSTDDMHEGYVFASSQHEALHKIHGIKYKKRMNTLKFV